jgi:hypothetical protein
MSSKRVTVFDSGCSISGTCNLLSDHLHSKLGPLELDSILPSGLGKQTLISLSQFCAGGDTGVQSVGIFNVREFRMFRIDSILPALKLIAERRQEVARGTVKEGIYVQEST